VRSSHLLHVDEVIHQPEPEGVDTLEEFALAQERVQRFAHGLHKERILEVFSQGLVHRTDIEQRQMALEGVVKKLEPELEMMVSDVLTVHR
tara:strand:+ start:185 stop:457 length:273 start_codon:yes stop_codon:yes gene_type:complete